MPMAFFEGDEFGATETHDRLGANAALFGKHITITISTERLVLTRSELLSSKVFTTLATSETFTMPRDVLVSNTAFGKDSIAFCTSLCILILETWDADNFITSRNEALVLDRFLANITNKTLFMPLCAFVFKLLHASLEWLLATVTSGCKQFIVTVRAEDLIVLVGKWLIYQRLLTLTTFEAKFMPVLILVGQVLVVRSDWFLAFKAIVGK